MNKRSIAVTQLILTGVLWSLGGILIKTTELHPLGISSVRSLLAALVLLVFLSFRPRFTFNKAQIIGALCYVGTVSLFVAANKLTTAANAILLQYGAPIYAVFMGHFILGERLKWYDFAAIAGMAVGMVIFFADSLSGGLLRGNIIAALSGVTFAGQAVCLRLQKDGSQVETILLGNIFAVLLGLPFVMASLPSMPQIAPLIILGIFQLGIPYILYSMAAKNVTALDLIIIPMIEPILNPVWVFMGTGEKPGINSLAGGAIVIAMVAFKSYFMLKGTDRKQAIKIESHSKSGFE